MWERARHRDDPANDERFDQFEQRHDTLTAMDHVTDQRFRTLLKERPGDFAR